MPTCPGAGGCGWRRARGCAGLAQGGRHLRLRGSERHPNAQLLWEGPAAGSGPCRRPPPETAGQLPGRATVPWGRCVAGGGRGGGQRRGRGSEPVAGIRRLLGTVSRRRTGSAPQLPRPSPRWPEATPSPSETPRQRSRGCETWGRGALGARRPGGEGRDFL